MGLRPDHHTSQHPPTHRKETTVRGEWG
jgi:hypothetical protein